MHKIKRITSLFLCFSVIAGCLCGCGEEKVKSNIICDTLLPVNNIDPQLCENDVELQIAYNTFEGLMTYDKNSVLTKGVIDNYTVSENGKKYYFTLKDGLKWSDGSPLTAYDFVFAFKRAVTPVTDAPYSYTLFSIKNAKAIVNGKKKKSKLGVSATDDKHLTIILEAPDTNFLHVLSTPICMPCQEKFFLKCKGFYGLSDDKILCNGSYKPTNWNDEYISFTENSEYKGIAKPKIDNFYFYFNDEEKVCENIQKGDTDYCMLNYTAIDNLRAADTKLNIERVNDTMFSLMFNKKSNVYQQNILAALHSTVDFSIPNRVKNYYGAYESNSVLPHIISDYDTVTAKSIKPLSKKAAVNSFMDGCEILKVEPAFPAVTISYINDSVTEDIARQIANNWQSVFGMTVNISACADLEELKYIVSQGTYDLAIMPTVALSNDMYEYLCAFSSSSNLNYFNYKNGEYDKTLKKLSKATGNTKTKYANKLVTFIQQSKYILPLYSASKIHYYGENVKININNANKSVYFAYCK